MSSNNKLIFAADPVVSGALRVAPLGTVIPTDGTFTAQTALTNTWVDLGNMGEDGFTEKLSKKIDKKYNFGGKMVKILQSEFEATLEFTFMESLNALVLKAIFGDANVLITPANSQHGTQVQVDKNSSRLPHQSWVVDTYDSETTARYRNWVPDGQIFDIGDIKVVTTDIIEYKITLECFETLLGDGKLAAIRTFTDDGILATGS